MPCRQLKYVVMFAVRCIRLSVRRFVSFRSGSGFSFFSRASPSPVRSSSIPIIDSRLSIDIVAPFAKSLAQSRNTRVQPERDHPKALKKTHVIFESGCAGGIEDSETNRQSFNAVQYRSSNYDSCRRNFPTNATIYIEVHFPCSPINYLR